MTVVGAMSKRLEEVEKHGILARGRKELIKYLSGDRISLKAAILAKCYECMGYYVDGKHDCLIPTCPLYLYSCYHVKTVAPRQKQPIPEGLRKYLKKKGTKNESK